MPCLLQGDKQRAGMLCIDPGPNQRMLMRRDGCGVGEAAAVAVCGRSPLPCMLCGCMGLTACTAPRSCTWSDSAAVSQRGEPLADRLNMLPKALLAGCGHQICHLLHALAAAF